MKTFRFAVLVTLALVALMVLGVMAAAADGPAPNATPGTATYFDNQPHPIAANSSLWFKFYYSLTYSGGIQETKMSMPYGNSSNVGFGIWTPDNVHDLVGKGPFGQGQPQKFPCNGTWCQGDDLVWQGSLGATGWYYVQVSNYSSSDTTENLQITGDGIYAAAPVPTPFPTPLSSPNMDDPAVATVIDGSPATIPGNSARWFKFDYLTDYNKPPFVTIRLLYGVITGLKFQVFAPERLGAWWDIYPNGYGTTEIVACPSGHCATNDVTWGGAFGATGTYFVRVINPNASDVTTTLSLSWR